MYAVFSLTFIILSYHTEVVFRVSYLNIFFFYPDSFFFFYKFVYLKKFFFGCIRYLFFSFWLRLVFVATLGLSLVAASGGYSSLQCMGFSLRWLLLLQSTGCRHAGSVVVACRLSSCGAWASLLRGMWDPPGPGLEPVSPALAGGFLTTVPPGKPLNIFLVKISALGVILRKAFPTIRK